MGTVGMFRNGRGVRNWDETRTRRLEGRKRLLGHELGTEQVDMNIE
jgi:hypothetical protein